METDYSREIYDKYLSSEGKILLITLKDNTVLEGIIVSFFHGDTESGEPYIVRWHFLDKNEIEKYHNGLDVSLEGNQDVGRLIEHKDIKNVRFKE